MLLQANGSHIMNKHIHLCVAVIACLSALGEKTAPAAEIRMSSSVHGDSIATIEGKLEIGDYAKIKAFLESNKPTQLYLASPGGNLGEAMSIGLMIRTLNLSTIVPGKPLTSEARELALTQHGMTNSKENYSCASACFFIFVAGVHRSSDKIGPALLGIHHPFVPGKDVVALMKNNAINAEGDLEKTIGKYLSIMDVPEKYLENMFSTPKGKILWIRNDEFEEDFDGFIPRLKQWAQSQCHSELAKNKNDCERSVQNELARRGYGETTSEEILSPRRDQ